MDSPNPSTRSRAWPLGAVGSWLAVTVAWWALAFAPLPVADSWLQNARAVCFGSLPGGLPGPEGWLMLVMGPISMLALITALFGKDLLESLSWLGRRPFGRWAMVATCAGVLLGLGAVGNRVADVSRVGESLSLVPNQPLPEHYPRIDRPSPSFRLLNQGGDEVSLASFAGRPVLLTFAYAHCQTICPIIVERSRNSIEEAAEPKPVLVVITLDPWRDTPASLPRIVEAWNLADRQDNHLLSGNPDEVVRVLQDFDVPFERDESTGEVTHPALLYLIDGGGRIAYAMNNPSVDWITTALSRMDDESARMDEESARMDEGNENGIQGS